MLALQEYFFLDTTKMHKRDLLKLIEVIIEKQVFEERKSEELTFEISIWKKIGQNNFLQKKSVLAPQEVIFFWVTNKCCTKESSSSRSESVLKDKSLKHEKKTKNKRFKSRFGCNYNKLFKKKTC